MKQIAITENHLFSKAYSKGTNMGSRSIYVYVLKDTHAKLLKKQNPQKEFVNRVGLTATKKIGGAVERNRAKRVIREAYRQIEKEYGIKKGNIIVIAARECCTRVKTQDVYDDMMKIFSKLDLLINNKEEVSQ